MESKPDHNVLDNNLEPSQEKSSIIKAIHVYESLVLPSSADDESASNLLKQKPKRKISFKLPTRLEKLTQKAKFNNRYFENSHTLEKNKRQAIVRSQGYFKY